MQELVRVKTNAFELTIWCANVSTRQQSHETTLTKRGISLRSSYSIISSLSAQEIEVAIPCDCVPVATDSGSRIDLADPVFFENNQYHFEWIFTGTEVGVENAKIVHRSRRLVDGFRFAEARGQVPARLTGTVLTGNDIGWMSVRLRYRTELSSTEEVAFAFEVLPTKMDLDTDLPAMYESIDRTFPLWRFSLSEVTQFGVSKGSNRGDFPIMWLANFGELRMKFESALKVIENAPHTKLQPIMRSVKAARMRDRVSDRVGMKIREDFMHGRFDKNYAIHKKKLSFDTPENRFIKMAVERCSTQLAQLEQRLRADNEVPDKQRLTENFFQELGLWRKPLTQFLHNGFIKDSSKFEGLSGQETALQRKTGYASAYRCWQELKYYLDAFEDTSRISLKSVADIYEVWCFIELRRILIDELGFTETITKRANLVLKTFLEYEMQDGFRGAFEFKREDGVFARLVHEPRFSPNGRDIKSYLVTQKPDILLEINWPGAGQKRLIWLFDAKYRIRAESRQYEQTTNDDIDFVPDDALNQMHRYRDALIRTVEVEKDSLKSKSRPVVGAFALYPGFYDQAENENPYEEPIREIGIGAFALLPSDEEGCGSRWLTEFLKSQIGVPSDENKPQDSPDADGVIYVQEAARIPYEGMQQVLYPDLVMTAAIAGSEGRDAEYVEGFSSGLAKWYHIPQKRFDEKSFAFHVVQEIRYLAFAVYSSIEPNTRSIERIWPINGVTLIPRKSISNKQAGRKSDSDELYYLFSLGKSLALQDPVTHVPQGRFRQTIKFTTLELLEKVSEFEDIESVYLDVRVSSH